MAHLLRRAAAGSYGARIVTPASTPHRRAAVSFREQCAVPTAMAFSDESKRDGDGDSVVPSRRVSWSMGMVPVAEEGEGEGAAGERETREDRSSTLWPGMYHSPVTAALWQARASIRERDGRHGAGVSPVVLMRRTPAMSRTSVMYNLAEDEVLREQYRNPWNGCRIGKLLEDLDALAGTIAMKVCLLCHCSVFL